MGEHKAIYVPIRRNEIIQVRERVESRTTGGGNSLASGAGMARAFLPS